MKLWRYALVTSSDQFEPMVFETFWSQKTALEAALEVLIITGVKVKILTRKTVKERNIDTWNNYEKRLFFE